MCRGHTGGRDTQPQTGTLPVVASDLPRTMPEPAAAARAMRGPMINRRPAVVLHGLVQWLGVLLVCQWALAAGVVSSHGAGSTSTTSTPCGPGQFRGPGGCSDVRHGPRAPWLVFFVVVDSQWWPGHGKVTLGVVQCVESLRSLSGGLSTNSLSLGPRGACLRAPQPHWQPPP
jgi:hypothetical protein